MSYIDSVQMISVTFNYDLFKLVYWNQIMSYDYDYIRIKHEACCNDENSMKMNDEYIEYNHC